MKNVLIVEAAPMFREFLKDKLSEEKVEVNVIADKQDSIIKMNSLLPDLTIFDIDENENIDYFIELLSKIKENPNASRIPMIATGPAASRENLAYFAKHGIVKYFVKPIKFDVFFESIGRILHSAFSMDTTPCVMDIHRNRDIIFIAIAQGLNREKLSLLKYKLSEIIENDSIDTPKIVLMMTNLELTFVDGLNIELLFDNILANSKILTKNIKVLSLDSFMKDFIEGHREYHGIEVLENLGSVLNSIVENETGTNVQELITDQILSPTDKKETGSVEMRFLSDTGTSQDSEGAVLNIAIIDGDINSAKIIEESFRQIGAEVSVYQNSASFVQEIDSKKFSLIIIHRYTKKQIRFRTNFNYSCLI